MNHLDV